NTTHEFKFIVEDDDANSFVWDEDGGLKMAIDDIRLFFVTSNDENAINSSIFDIRSIQGNQIVLSFRDINERKMLKMYDALGNSVHHAVIGRSEVGDFEIQNRFATGVYFIEVITETGKRQTEKVFIQ
ncbi:MAG TPA: T9SS type A sorting domain-containing protein, partial [Saprospiraceae bacterium]|nr:T9SS type A sorting domain-containing protein [Saprospiraceae bacterium]